MNFYTKKQSFLWQRVLLGIATLIAIIVFLNIFQNQFRNSFYLISSPIAKALSQAGSKASNIFVSFLSINNLKKENIDLTEENQKLFSEIALLNDLLRQNQVSKEAIETAKQSNFSLLAVKTIGLDSANDFILIDKGLEDGIAENMPVISSQKVLYGKVFKTYKNFSKVMLISSTASTIDVQIQNNDLLEPPIYGAVKGKGRLSLYLDLVSSDSEIKEGDTLITSALEGIFPRDLLVGRVINSSKNDLKPFQTAEIQPFFDVKNIDNLFLITDYMKK